MLKKIILLFVFLAIPFSLLAKESMEIDLSSNANVVSVGDSFQLQLTVKNASTNGINLEKFKIPGIENFRQNGTSQSTRMSIVNGVSMLESIYAVNLEANKEGDYELGPVDIEVKDENGGIQTVSSKTVNISVKQGKKLLQLGDNKGLVKENSEKRVYYYIGILKNIVVFLILIFLIYFYRQRHQKIKNESSNKSAEEEKIAFPSEEDSDFYIKMKEILIQFLSKNNSIDFSTKTSEEIYSHLVEKKYYKREEVKKALDKCDYGKFSKSDLDKKELTNLINKII